jgi:hypothetical protein
MRSKQKKRRSNQRRRNGKRASDSADSGFGTFKKKKISSIAAFDWLAVDGINVSGCMIIEPSGG